MDHACRRRRSSGVARAMALLTGVALAGCVSPIDEELGEDLAHLLLLYTDRDEAGRYADERGMEWTTVTVTVRSVPDDRGGTPGR
jgi:hypothetical protein